MNYWRESRLERINNPWSKNMFGDAIDRTFHNFSLGNAKDLGNTNILGKYVGERLQACLIPRSITFSVVPV